MAKITNPGTYAVQIKQTALNESKNTKAMQITVTFADVVNGDTITAYLPTSEKAWPYTEEKLRACGWDPAANGYRFEELNDDPSPIAGNDVEIVVDLETWDNKTEPRVKFINVPGGGFKRMESSEASSFADRLRRQLGVGSTSSQSQRRLPRDPAPKATNGKSDDVPF